MEFSILFSYFLFLITLFCSLLFIYFNGKKHQNVPPGSSGWPFIGETLDYLRTAKNGVPEKFMSDRRKKYSSDVFKTSLLGESMVLLCTAEGNKFMFSNENKLVKSWWPKNIEKIFDISFKSSRSSAEEAIKILRPLLKPNSLGRNNIGIIDEATKQHLNTYWDGKEVVKAHALAKQHAFAVACKLFFSLENLEVIEKFKESVHNITSGIVALPINLPGTRFNRAVKSSRQLKEEVEKIVAQRRKAHHAGLEESSDVMSDFLSYSNGDNGQQMKDSEIARFLAGMVVGAYDSVSVTLVSIMSFLAELPEVYDGVFREQMEIAKSKAPGELLNWEDIQKMKYSWNVACEVLRLSPPTPGTFREAICDFTYQGFLIPKGIKLHWNAYATHKSPKYFPEPEKFDPSRFEGNGPIPFSYVPFGGGPRMCPGYRYARVELLVFMHNVVKKFKWEKVFPQEKFIMDPILAPQKGLPIRLYPHVEKY